MGLSALAPTLRLWGYETLAQSSLLFFAQVTGSRHDNTKKTLKMSVEVAHVNIFLSYPHSHPQLSSR